MEKQKKNVGFLRCLCSLVLCAQLQFVCVQFYMNEAFLLSTGKDADRRKPAA